MHHLGFAFGYEKLLSDDLKDDASGIDFTNAGYGSLAYRLSVMRNLDLTLDARVTVSSESSGGVDVTLTNSFFGPGIRLISPNEGTRPYVQANFFFVEEEAEAEQGGVNRDGLGEWSGVRSFGWGRHPRGGTSLRADRGELHVRKARGRRVGGRN
jgi:hypothetical protein